MFIFVFSNDLESNSNHTEVDSITLLHGETSSTQQYALERAFMSSFRLIAQSAHISNAFPITFSLRSISPRI